ncbi:hypothetical protein B0T10DRAFT_566305 [Thelonectria olida]|uniref:Uncharacterized protein n=1 Tax=Thelonectria olida TaxID=1576542 RepID=A0A9P8VU04_9HYPO|nr:hypothetical protein B0T10DRAFT_566305 [Thelonectria olida]
MLLAHARQIAKYVGVPAAMNGTKSTSQNTLDARVGAMHPLGLNDNLDLLKKLLVNGSATLWCMNYNYNEEQQGFYLMGIYRKEHCAWEDAFTGYECRDFTAPPGLEEIDGTKRGGVTQEDLVIAQAQQTLRANTGETDKRPEETDLNANDMLSRLREVNTRAPGLVWFPLCSAEEAYGNWEKHV